MTSGGTLCLACSAVQTAVAHCLACHSPRIITHPELFTLAIAHVDCDAFYASVEKRDRPELADRPVIIGGGTRGVVSTACYIARLSGVGSAMPMFKALRLCPDAVVIKPDFTKYNKVAKELRVKMGALTPLVQPLSIDEAALDLSGTAPLHGAPPAVVLARFAREVEQELRITVSIGLARNRLLAKLAAGRDKPRGFSPLGAEAAAWLAPQPVGLLPGVGPAQAKKLAARGITRLGQLQALSDHEARLFFGAEGPELAARARGEDARLVDPVRAAKSISAETTFATDLSRYDDLQRQLWRMAEKLTTRLRAERLAATGISLKLKTAAFASRTRATRLPQPSALPDTLFTAASALLRREVDGTGFRLIGLGTTGLAPAVSADQPDLADPDLGRRVNRQVAIDKLRAKFGGGVIGTGRVL